MCKKTFIVDGSLTRKHSLLRVFLSYAGISECVLWSQDVDQAHIQNEEPLQNPTNARPPMQLDVPSNIYGSCSKHFLEHVVWLTAGMKHLENIQVTIYLYIAYLLKKFSMYQIQASVYECLVYWWMSLFSETKR